MEAVAKNVRQKFTSADYYQALSWIGLQGDRRLEKVT